MSGFSTCIPRCLCPWECRFPDVPNVDGTGCLPRVPQMNDPDLIGSLLRLRVNSRAASPRSDGQWDFANFACEFQPLVSSPGTFPFVPNLSLDSNLSWVCSNSSTKELSFLSLIPLGSLQRKIFGHHSPCGYDLYRSSILLLFLPQMENTMSPGSPPTQATYC
jgi:hypothetical protein